MNKSESLRQSQRPQVIEEVAYKEVIEKLRQTILDFKDDGLEMNAESVEIAREFLRKLSLRPNLLKSVSISADSRGDVIDLLRS